MPTILARTGLDEASLLINMSHTHAGANVNSQLTDKPGVELIEPYIEHLTEQIGAAILEAREAAAAAWVTYGTGRCALATNRDLWDAAAERFVCGYNPDEPADDTLLVARVTSETGEARATLFNYACHPTTLAWENRCSRPTISALHARSWSRRSAPRRSSSKAPRAISPRATTTSATRPSPTATAASLGTPQRPRSRACPRPGRSSSTPGSLRRAPTSVPGNTSRATRSSCTPASSWRRA